MATDKRVKRDWVEDASIRLTYRTMCTLAVIAAQRGLSNSEISERVGISDQGQISKLLARLARHGLIENTGVGRPRGGSNAWQLTRDGELLERRISTSLALHAVPPS